ncbi:MAG: zinc ribbon domain-containing protein [Coriobacteriia bacterium]|nr:zinc ribbon domain-containing protein [Coriobacteriia bacterium]
MGELTDLFAPITNSDTFRLISQLLLLFYIVFSVALVFWTYRDASRRGAMGWFWALTVAVFSLVFLGIPAWIIYMIVRPPEYADDTRERDLEIRHKEISLARDMETCPGCHKPVEKDFLICPYCMKKLRKSCVECGKPLKLAWNVCPFCKTKQ